MKKVLLILTVFFLTSSFVNKETYVFICKSTGSKRYHLTKTCRGLSPCKHTIEKVTKKSAEKIGRTLCKWED